MAPLALVKMSMEDASKVMARAGLMLLLAAASLAMTKGAVLAPRLVSLSQIG